MFIEIAIGTIALLNYLDARYNRPPTAPLRDFILPRVDEGAVLPIVYGRCRVRAPVIIWSGNYTTPGDTFTDAYSGDVLFAVGVPFFGGRADLMLNGMWYGDIKFGLLVSAVSSDLYNFSASVSGSPLDAHFSGEYYPGSLTQNVTATGSMTAARMAWGGADSTLIPGHVGVILLACVSNQGAMQSVGGFETGTSPDVGSVSLEVRSRSTGSLSDLGVSGWSSVDDADPAAVIYDMLASPWGRAALPTAKIDTTSFAAASATLLAEGHGYSRSIETADDLLTLVGDVLRQIDAVAYEEPTTGKIELHLIRADYTVASLADINPTNARLLEYSVQGQSETFNQVRITFSDRLQGYGDKVSIAQNQANVVNQGGKLRGSDVRFVGCTTTALAQKIAGRELAALSVPQVKITVECNRSFYTARPGQVFTFTWPELGVATMVMRVVTVNLGQLHSSKITMQLMRDIYDQSLGAFPQL